MSAAVSARRAVPALPAAASRPVATLIVADPGFVRFALEAMIAQLEGVTTAGVVSPDRPGGAYPPGLRPDLVVVDLDLRSADPLSVLAGLRGAIGPVPVLGIARSRQWDVILGALDRGITSLLLEDSCDPDELRRTIRAAAAGTRHVDPRIARDFVAARSKAMPLARLSDRQREVLDLIAQGRSNHDIAAHLHIAEPTVKTHLTHIYRVIGVANRTQAALWARSLRLASALVGGDPAPDGA